MKGKDTRQAEANAVISLLFASCLSPLHTAHEFRISLELLTSVSNTPGLTAQTASFSSSLARVLAIEFKPALDAL